MRFSEQEITRAPTLVCEVIRVVRKVTAVTCDMRVIRLAEGLHHEMLGFENSYTAAQQHSAPPGAKTGTRISLIDTRT